MIPDAPMSLAQIHRLKAMPFDRAPEPLRAKAFGVDYVRVITPEGGELYVTDMGWPRLDHLLPERWYDRRKYARQGIRLPGGTGAVYRVPVVDRTGAATDLVVKFSRMAQDLPLHFERTFGSDVPLAVVDAASFNSPFEEFGLLVDLRRGRFGPPHLKILTKRPLAIYSPPREHELWRLARSKGRFRLYERALAMDQAVEHGPAPVHLELTHDYILLYHWIKGMNAEAFFEQGDLTLAELEMLTRRVQRELTAKGFRVLDNKPKHFILRKPTPDGPLLRRHGQLVYALVDFELLQRTEAYEAYLHEQGIDYLDFEI